MKTITATIKEQNLIIAQAAKPSPLKTKEQKPE